MVACCWHELSLPIRLRTIKGEMRVFLYGTRLHKLRVQRDGSARSRLKNTAEQSCTIMGISNYCQG
jgi:hypothetical protein